MRKLIYVPTLAILVFAATAGSRFQSVTAETDANKNINLPKTGIDNLRQESPNFGSEYFGVKKI